MPETLNERVLAYIRRHELMRAGDRVGVAVSGGADSVALLRLLLELRTELGVVLSIVHFNHQIRGAEADIDERFVAALAEGHGLELNRASGNVPARAAARSVGIETAARQLRYGYFRHLLRRGAVSTIATAHTLDDQAETVLMRFVRGAWTKGLAGIYPRLPIRDDVSGKECGTVIRPLLEIRRPELEQYLRSLRQDWREDATNRDVKLVRNRVRHVLLPLLEREFNPAVRQVLADAAEIARAEEDFWNQVLREHDFAGAPPLSLLLARTPTLSEAKGDGQRKGLEQQGGKDLPLALARRLARALAERHGLALDFQQVERILALAAPSIETGATYDLAAGWVAERQRERIVIRAAATPAPAGYEYLLPVPGKVRVKETGTLVSALVTPLKSAQRAYNRETLLDRQSVGAELRVRNWRPGDRFWPAHTKSPRKVKELLQARHISGAERASWPVVVSGSELVWMRGFLVPARFAAGPAATEGILIEESSF